MRRVSRLAIVSAALSVPASAFAVVTSQTVSFQPGVDGYSGLVERLVSSSTTSQLPSAANPTPANWFVDGGGTAASPDQQALQRWENIIGSGAHQIPAGATILNAKLTLTTGSATDSTAAQTGGWYGVAGLTGKQILSLGGTPITQQFNSTTTYGNFDVSGPNYSNANGLFAGRAVGSFIDPTDAATLDGDSVIDQDQVVSANVSQLVQKWTSNPTSNYGLAVQAGIPAATTDGWMFGTQWHPDTTRRPKLEVTYTTDTVETVSFQQGVNGYTGAVSAWVKADNNVASPYDGSQLNQQFLDGPAAGSPDDQGLFRFNNIFSDEGGQIDRDAEIIDAKFVLTTGDTSTNSPTRGSFDVAGVTRDWDLDITNAEKPSLYSEWSNGFGPSSDDPDGNAQTDLTASIGRIDGMTNAQIMSVDITALFNAWKDGTMANYGLNVQSYNTADGWQINFDGATDSSARPQLIVRTLVPTGHWIADADGTWAATANWQAEKVPNGKGHIAIFGSAISAARTVTLGADTKLGTVRFDSAFSYTIAGTAGLTLDRSATSDVSIEVVQGQHTISAPVTLAHSTTIDVATGASLAITGTLNANGINVTKSSGGVVTLPGIRAASLSVNGGAVAIAPSNTSASTSVLSNLSIAAGAKLDLNDNALVVDFATGGPSPLAMLSAAAADGRLMSSIASANSRLAIGVVDGSKIEGGVFAGVTLDADMVVADLTLKGDTNLNYIVNFDDLLALAQNYDAAGTVKVWSDGDSNYDGIVNFDDLLSLAQNYGTSAIVDTSVLLDDAGISQAIVSDWKLAQSLAPEPTAIAGIVLAAGVLSRRRTR